MSKHFCSKIRCQRMKEKQTSPDHVGPAPGDALSSRKVTPYPRKFIFLFLADSNFYYTNALILLVTHSCRRNYCKLIKEYSLLANKRNFGWTRAQRCPLAPRGHTSSGKINLSFIRWPRILLHSCFLPIILRYLCTHASYR